MARNSSKKKGRVTVVNARQSLPLSSNLVSPVKYNKIPSSLKYYEDRRRWHPEGAYAPAASFNRSKHSLIDGSTKNSRRTRSWKSNTLSNLQSLSGLGKSHIRFDVPEKVLICVRRKIRKQVMHALRKSGRVGQRRPKYNWYSKIRCK